MEFSVKLPRLLATLPRCEQWPRKRGTSCHFSQFGCGFAALRCSAELHSAVLQNFTLPRAFSNDRGPAD